MISRSYIIFILIFSAFSQVLSQELNVLSYDQFINDVKRNHPVITMSALTQNIQAEKKTEALGAFDPIISANSDQKSLDQKNYFTYQNAEIQIPTWYGIEVYSGIENNRGLFTNPETSLGNLAYLGLSVPIGRDLILDKRRAKLAEAKLMINYTANEQQMVINNLLLDASMAYIDWTMNYEQVRLLKESLDLINIRKQAIISSVKGGDRAAIDTVEIVAQINSIEQSYQESLVAFINAQYDLSSYLWTQDRIPVLIKDTTIPDTMWLEKNNHSDLLLSLPDQIASVHPKLSLLDTKIELERIDLRMANQSLLPKIDLKFNALSTDVISSPVFGQPLSHNYKFGIDFSMPIPNRYGFANQRIQKAKINSIIEERKLTFTQLELKIANIQNEMKMLASQKVVTQSAVQNYTTLLEAEKVRFDLGESTQFLLNSRENKLIETNIKLIQVKSKLKKAEMKYKGLSFEL
jgi:outer membrane protein TolC